MKAKTFNFLAMIDPKDAQVLDAIAEQKQMSRLRLVRTIISDYVTREQKRQERNAARQ